MIRVYLLHLYIPLLQKGFIKNSNVRVCSNSLIWYNH
nr:MAG TPA_asm: hypothetical protein [Caudoviricetes sp.]